MTSEKCPHCKRKAFFVGDYCAACRRHRATGEPGDSGEIQALMEQSILDARQRVQGRVKKPAFKVADPAIQEWLESLLQKTTEGPPPEPLMAPQLCPHCGEKTYFAEDYCCHCRCHQSTGLPGDPVKVQALINAAILKLRQSTVRKMAVLAEEE